MSDARLLETFLELVRIYSPSGREAEVAERCAAMLADAGCSVRFDESAATTGSNVGNLIAELPGTAPGVLALSAHFDVVEPSEGVEPVIRDGLILSAGDTVLGSDDRAGLATAIEAVRRLAADPAPRPTIRVLFTVQEEVGLVGAKALDAADAACDLCLVLDADGTPGGIVVGAPWHHTFTAVFTGRAAHAGVSPEQGISAVRIAADAVTRMELARLDETTTANIGSIKGGAATNVVPARCDLTGECRSLVAERAEVVRSAMDAAMRGAAEAAGGSVDVVWKLEYEGFLYPDEDPRVALVADACRDVGLEPRTFRTGGGSDANVLSGLGVTTLALSCGMTGVHGTSEQIAVEDLNSLTRLIVAVARRIAGS